MRGDFDRFTWKPGEGTDSVDGGGSHDSMFFHGIPNTEVFDFFRDRHDVRFVHDPGAEAVDLHSVEELDGIAFGGEDIFGVRNLAGTGVDLDRPQPGAELRHPRRRQRGRPCGRRRRTRR